MSIALETKVKELEARVKALEDASRILREANVTIPSGYVESAGDPLVAAYTKRFGEPPHHRMKRETIEAKLRG